MSLIATASVAHPGIGAAQTPRDPLYQQISDTLQASLGADAHGAALAIIYNGTIEYTAGIGTKQRGGTAPVTADTLFRVASTTKMFTAGLAAQLAVEGTLNLTTPITTYIPQLSIDPWYWASGVRLDRLLKHTAGVPDSVEPYCTQTMQEWFVAHPSVDLEFSPSSGSWAYSNQGFAIAGHAIERALGVQFPQALQQRIFTPLGLDATFDNAVAQSGDFATGYWPGDDDLPEGTGATDFSCSVSNPSGLLWASATDMAKYARALLSLRTDVLSSTAVNNMRSNMVSAGGYSGMVSYGLGLAEWEKQNGYTLYGHNGFAPGYFTKVVLIPSKQFAIVVLTAGDGADPDPAIQQAINLLLPACHTATNSAHVTAGRAYKSTVYRAVGSNADLGRYGTTTTSLKETSTDYWQKVTSCN